MDCRATRTRLSALLDEELNPADAQAVRTHIYACRECGSLYGAYEQDMALLRSFVATAPCRPVRALERLTTRRSALQRSLVISARGLARATQVTIVLAVVASLALVLRTLPPEIARPTLTGQTDGDPTVVVDAFLAARADQDVPRVRALFDDEATIDLNGQRVELRTLHFDSELRHWLLPEKWQTTYTGPRAVLGDQVTWREHVVVNTPRLAGLPAVELDEDLAAFVRAGKIVSLTFTVSPTTALEANPAASNPP